MDGDQPVSFRVLDQQRNHKVSDVVPVQVSNESNHRAIGITSAINSTVLLNTVNAENSELMLLPGDEVIEVAGVLVDYDLSLIHI